jgi:hypothetical protein
VETQSTKKKAEVINAESEHKNMFSQAEKYSDKVCWSL